MIFDYIKHGTRYLFVSVIIAAILVWMFSFFSKERYSRRKCIKRLIIMSYFLTLGLVVFGGRYQYGTADTYQFKCNLYLFENLRIAVREQSADTIIQMIFNILMFIPCGGVLLWIVGKELWKRVFIYIPLLSIFVETIQYLAGWGLFDVDDLLCNILGGYWGTLLILAVAEKKKWSQTATIAISTLIAGVFLAYYFMPFGFMPEDVINVQHMKPDIVEIEPDFFSQQTLNIYRMVKKEKENAISQIEAIFAAAGSSVDYGTKDEYDSCVIYRGIIPTHYIWYNFDGSFQLNLGQKGIQLPEGSTATESILLLLDKMGYCLPNGCKIEKPGKIIFHMVEYNGSIFDGLVEFSCDEKTLFSLSYGVKEMEYYREENTYTQEKIQKNLLRGLFSCSQPLNGGFSKMKVTKYFVEYSEDSKGYYRPIYCLSVTIDGKPEQITTPAISHYC